MATQTSEEKIVRGACAQDCPDTCAFLYTVEDDKLIDVRGDPDHPMTRGGLCVKLKDFAEHHYNPDRLLHPMKRVGPKGSGKFEQITYDEACAEIKKQWTAIIDEHGPQAIMNHCYLGNQGTLNGLTSGDAFFNRLGATIGEKCYCESSSATAWLSTVGPTGAVDLESLAHSKYIIVWAMNMMSTNLHAWPFILEAKKKGAKIVVIDPIRTRTAKQADWHIAINPGTDGALGLGMMNVIIEEDLVDHDYVDKYLLGYEELKARAAEFPPDKVAKITGIPAEDIRKLSREYATTQPSVIREGVALERAPGGGDAIRIISTLPALVGAWRHVGGGAVEMPIWEFPFDFDFMCQTQWIKEGTRVINQLDLGGALTGEFGFESQPLKSVFIHNSNPVSQQQNSNKLVKGLKREDLFTVVSDFFITDTARYADIILPAAMQGEQFDLQVTWGHLYFMVNNPAVPPPGECLSNIDMFRRLAKEMGYDDDYWDMTDEEVLMKSYDWNSPVAKGITLEKLKEVGWMRLNVGAPDERAPHAEGNFKTPSGKTEFKASALENGNFVAAVWRNGYNEKQTAEPVDVVPNYIPPNEVSGGDPKLAKRFPLSLISPKPHAFLNSQYANEPAQQRRQGGEQVVIIHPEDAATRKIESGDYVRVFNDRGSFEGKAELSEDVMKGLAAANLGYWQSMNRTLGAVNSTTSSAHSNIGGGGTQSDNLVQIEKVAA